MFMKHSKRHIGIMIILLFSITACQDKPDPVASPTSVVDSDSSTSTGWGIPFVPDMGSTLTAWGRSMGPTGTAYGPLLLKTLTPTVTPSKEKHKN